MKNNDLRLVDAIATIAELENELDFLSEKITDLREENEDLQKKLDELNEK